MCVSGSLVLGHRCRSDFGSSSRRCFLVRVINLDYDRGIQLRTKASVHATHGPSDQRTSPQEVELSGRSSSPMSSANLPNLPANLEFLAAVECA